MGGGGIFGAGAPVPGRFQRRVGRWFSNAAARSDANPTPEKLDERDVGQPAHQGQQKCRMCYAAVQVLPADVLTPAATIHMNRMVVAAHNV